MNHLLLIIILTFYLSKIYSQDVKLVHSDFHLDNSKDCRKIGNCISAKNIKNDTLLLNINFDNNCRDLKAYRDSFNFNDGVLNIFITDTFRIKYVKRNDSVIDIIQVMVYNHCIGGYDTEIGCYKFIGFKNLPKFITFDNQMICDCPTKPIKFDFYNGDTINMINANGQKHGLWLSFYDTGEIYQKKYFDNGRFINGQTFDKNGVDLHYIEHSDGDIEYLLIGPPK